MTGNLLIDSAISLSAIAVMVLVAWAAFKAPPKPVDEASARERLQFDEPDFTPAAWLFDRAGKAALAESVDGDFALVVRLGADLVTRRFAVGGAKAAERDGALIVRPADPGAVAVSFHSADAAAWVRKIAGA